MLKIEHAAPQDRFVAFGMADASKFKFVNDRADVFRAPQNAAKSTHRLLFRGARHRWGGRGSSWSNRSIFDRRTQVPHDRREGSSPTRSTPTFGRPCAVAMVDRWCVFLIDGALRL